MSIDLHKTFYSISFSSIKVTLKSMGFFKIIIDIVTNCITTLSFSMLMRLETEQLKSERGLKQVNPLSPYQMHLILVFENLSQTIKMVEQNDSIIKLSRTLNPKFLCKKLVAPT